MRLLSFVLFPVVLIPPSQSACGDAAPPVLVHIGARPFTYANPSGWRREGHVAPDPLSRAET